jgi:hypothetical protein
MILVTAMALTGCAAASDSPPTSTPTPTLARTEPVVVEFDQALHDELVAMLERDQSERTGAPISEGDQARTDRLKEIIEQHGWPTIGLVGDDGEDAAWAIAQHSDLDPDFQKQAVELLRDAVAAGQASPGNLAYLEDRVLVAQGKRQVYGTQVRCAPDGPEPATPIDDAANVEQRRADAGLDTLADYLAEMAVICAEIPVGG